ncbi:MAG: PhzF family phenazine biosynthesis protein [Pseudomonadota bacterium]
MSAPGKLCSVDVFYGHRAAGNRHHIAFRTGPGWRELPVEFQQTANLILLNGGVGAFQAQFFSVGRPVRRCGSGNLAVIAYLHEQLGCTGNEQRLCTPAGDVSLGFDRRSAYYRDKPLAQRPLRNFKFWQRLVRQPILNGCYCGGANDYVLLELEQPLAQLSFNATLLCRFSQRALIVIYRPPSGALQLRYFAPQYGPAEDAATGSASVQAAGYLRREYPRQLQRQPIEINQCSPAGGYLYLENKQQQVLVRGRTASWR